MIRINAAKVTFTAAARLYLDEKPVLDVVFGKEEQWKNIVLYSMSEFSHVDPKICFGDLENPRSPIFSSKIQPEVSQNTA